MKRILFQLVVIFYFIPCIIFPAPQSEKDFLTGADMLFKERLPRLKGKKIGILTNHTALLKNGTHLIDSLFSIKTVKITSLFSPEHGIRGSFEAGAAVNNETDTKTGLKVVSLYGKNYKIKKEDLENIDILLFDLQDIGVRYFTYISTLKYAVESCAENRVELWVLDRPNPISPVKPDGPLTEKSFTSFVSIAPIPIIHGMTTGELANYFNYLLNKEKRIRCTLSVVKMKNWDRKKYYSSYKTNWIKPSPNMTGFETALAYAGTCMIEGTNVSEGRGTYKPFLTIGAPFIDGEKLADALTKEKIKGMVFSPIRFIPESIAGTVTNPKYEGKQCSGIEIRISDSSSLEPVKFGIILLYTLNRFFPEFRFKDKTIDNLIGSDYPRKMLLNGEKPEKIFLKWQKELNNFINLRAKFLLY